MKKSAFTLVELLMVTLLLTFVFIGGVAVMGTSFRLYNATTAQFDADTTGSMMIQHLTRDLQEAMRVDVLSDTSIRIYYPIKDANGEYTRSLSTTTTVDYYRGTSTQAANATGAFIYRKPVDGPTKVVCKGVTSLEFFSSSPTSVEVSLSDTMSSGSAYRQCNIIHRAIFLRNY